MCSHRRAGLDTGELGEHRLGAGSTHRKASDRRAHTEARFSRSSIRGVGGSAGHRASAAVRERVSADRLDAARGLVNCSARGRSATCYGHRQTKLLRPATPTWALLVVPADAIPWIVSAERAQTRERRIDDTRDMLVSGAGIDSKAIAARKAAE